MRRKKRRKRRRKLNAECSEQIKTVDNCFLSSECAETRSNGSEACPHEQYDYVSRVRMQNCIDNPTVVCYTERKRHHAEIEKTQRTLV